MEPAVYKFDPDEDTQDFEQLIHIQRMLDMPVEERYRRFFEACAFAREMLRARAPEAFEAPRVVKRA